MCEIHKRDMKVAAAIFARLSNSFEGGIISPTDQKDLDKLLDGISVARQSEPSSNPDSYDYSLEYVWFQEWLGQQGFKSYEEAMIDVIGVGYSSCCKKNSSAHSMVNFMKSKADTALIWQPGPDTEIPDAN